MIAWKASTQNTNSLRYKLKIILIAVLLAVALLGFAYKVRQVGMTSLSLSRELRAMLLAEMPELKRQDVEFYSYANCGLFFLDACAGATFSEQILKEPGLLAKIISTISKVHIKERIVINIVHRIPYSRNPSNIVLTITKHKQ